MALLASKGFLVGVTVAAFVVAGTAVAWYSSTREGAFAFTTGECGAVLGGRPIESSRDDSGVHGSEPRRVVTYEINASGLVGGAIEACTSVGDVEVTPSGDDAAHVVFIIRSEKEADREIVRDTEVKATFVAEDGGLLLVASHLPKRAEQRDAHSVVVSVRVEVPASGAYAFSLTTGVGDVRLDGFEAKEIVANTGVGDVGVFGVDATDDVTATTGVGDVEVDLLSVASSTLRATTGTGDVRLAVPAGNDVGYDVRASTGVGHVEIALGPTEAYDETESEVGGDVHARTKGYSERATKVEIAASTGVGDVLIAS